MFGSTEQISGRQGVVVGGEKHNESNTGWVETQSSDLRLMIPAQRTAFLTNKPWVWYEPCPGFGVTDIHTHTHKLTQGDCFELLKEIWAIVFETSLQILLGQKHPFRGPKCGLWYGEIIRPQWEHVILSEVTEMVERTKGHRWKWEKNETN